MLRNLTAPTVLGAILNIYSLEPSNKWTTELVNALEDAATSPRVNMLFQQRIMEEAWAKTGKRRNQYLWQMLQPNWAFDTDMSQFPPFFFSYLNEFSLNWINGKWFLLT